MLHISASSHRKFEIACTLASVETHFSNFERMLEDLPALKVIQVWGAYQYRIAYSANIAGVYEVDLFGDVQVQFDAAAHTLNVFPLRGFQPVTAQATLRSLSAQGDYTSRVIFRPHGGRTVVDYDLIVAADIPKPVRLNLLPNPVARMAVQVVVQRRVTDMVDLFVDRTVNHLTR
jgi:hypothetical protein